MKKVVSFLLILSVWGCSSSSGESPFLWDFSDSKVYSYSFVQEVKSDNKINSKSPATTQAAKVAGSLMVKSKGNGMADVSMTKMEMSNINFDAAGNKLEGPASKVPGRSINDMRENGSFANPMSDILFNLILALPTEGLKDGESQKIALEMPLNTGDVSLISKGYHTLSFDGFKDWNDRNCAVIKGVIDISEMDIPKEYTGEYSYSNIGETIHYFDLEHRVYVGSEVDMTISILVDDQNEQGIGTYLNLKSDNHIELTYQEI